MANFDDYNKVSKLLTEAQDADEDNRELAKEAHLFVTDPAGQWEQEQWNNADGKPRYTFDQTSPIVDQIAGDIAQSDFDIKLKPSGGNATKENAQLLDGLIRNIETISNARMIYANAGRNMCTAGFDNWMVKTGYASDDSFDQDLFIEPLFNSENRVWYDVGAQRQDRSDSKYGFLLSAIPKDEYNEKWPDGSGLSVSDGSDDNVYYDKAEMVIIGHVFYRKMKSRELVKTNLGRVFEKDSEEFNKVKDELEDERGEIVSDTRTVMDSVFYVRKFDGGDWLGDEEETVFSTIPLVPVFGNYKVIENKPLWHGVVQKLMDAQRVLNYSMSREIEEGALAPRAKYWLTDKEAAGHEAELATMNTNSDPVQIYSTDEAVTGRPQQSGGAQINPGLRVISDGMQQVMGRTAGIFAAGMGDNPNAQSGVAIERLQNKSNNVTIKYFNAMEIGVCRTAQLLLEGIPKVYDTERQVRILGEDGSFEMQTVNQQVFDEQTQEFVTLNDLSVGQYDVTCTVGPSFDSRQSEMVNSILSYAAIDPSVLELGGDILLNNMNAPGMDKLADRKRAMLLNSGMIPIEQMTDEEREQVEQANQGQEPDPMMVAAEAEMAKAQAESMKVQATMQKNQIEMMEAQAKLDIDIQKVELARGKLQMDAQKQEMEFMEKLAKLDKEANKEQFDMMMAMQEQQRQVFNDAINNLNTQADTLNKLRDAMGVDTVVGPNNMQAYARQADEVITAQDLT